MRAALPPSIVGIPTLGIHTLGHGLEKMEGAAGSAAPSFPDQPRRSKRSRSITLVQAATKSRVNFCALSSWA